MAPNIFSKEFWGKKSTTVLSAQQVTPENAVREMYKQVDAAIGEDAAANRVARERVVAAALAEKEEKKRVAEAAAQLKLDQTETLRLAEENKTRPRQFSRPPNMPMKVFIKLCDREDMTQEILDRWG